MQTLKLTENQKNQNILLNPTTNSIKKSTPVRKKRNPLE
jgi:hypothetical protein